MEVQDGYGGGEGVIPRIAYLPFTSLPGPPKDDDFLFSFFCYFFFFSFFSFTLFFSFFFLLFLLFFIFFYIFIVLIFKGEFFSIFYFCFSFL
jgi:hypothetical protein